MSRIRSIAFAIILASWCVNASAFVTGNALAELCGVTKGPATNAQECIGYITGALDSARWAVIRRMPLPKPDDPQFLQDFYFSSISVFCPPEGVTGGQLVAVVLKHLRDNPAGWHLPLPAARYVVTALEAAFPCNK